MTDKAKDYGYDPAYLSWVIRQRESDDDGMPYPRDQEFRDLAQEHAYEVAAKMEPGPKRNTAYLKAYSEKLEELRANED